MGALLQFTMNVEHVADCGICGVSVLMAHNLYQQKLKDRSTWYCVNGHPRCFAGETEAQKLKRELEFEKNRRESAEKSRDTARKAEAIARGKLKATTERVANGVCPCCNRTFQNLMRHMATKHPSFKGAT